MRRSRLSICGGHDHSYGLRIAVGMSMADAAASVSPMTPPATSISRPRRGGDLRRCVGGARSRGCGRAAIGRPRC